MAQEQQTPRKQILSSISFLVPRLVLYWPPTVEQKRWMIRMAIVPVFVLVPLTLISLQYEITPWEWIKVLAVPITIGAAVPLLSWLQKRRELEFQERRAQTDALLQFLDQLTQLLLVKDKQNTRLVKMEITEDIREVISARTEAIGPLTPEGNQSLTNFLFGLGLLNKAAPILSLAGRNFSGVDWSGVDLTEVDLTGANLEGAKLENAKLEKANLSRAFLVGAVLTEANLKEADLWNGANLFEAKLIRADLRGAELIDRTDLSYADLEGADLREAVLDYNYSEARYFKQSGEVFILTPDMATHLEGAILKNANLHHAKITDKQLAECKSLEGATMPNGQKYEDWLKDIESGGEDGENSSPS